MVSSGLDVLLARLPDPLLRCRVGVLCHAASVTSRLSHIVDELARRSDITLGAVFGPQHGLFGQTQDNMIEWEGGYRHPDYGVPVYSLYGQTRTPAASMLQGLDALLVDLQDVGARPYTYVWTVKNCMAACAEQGIPVWVLDRPNPIAAVAFDGPMLDQEYFSFVGGAAIPRCHRMTMAEMARLIRARHIPGVELHWVGMDGWWRNSLWPETGLPWVLPSPNMPVFETAVVYPGMVLLEATVMSEGRGTTRPFELFGAPWLDRKRFPAALDPACLRGALLREHAFIPTFNKHRGEMCAGWQIHVRDPRAFAPVWCAAGILSAAHAAGGGFAWKQPPYEYEHTLMPVDILAGSSRLRLQIERAEPLARIRESWTEDWRGFAAVLDSVSLYPEDRS